MIFLPLITSCGDKTSTHEHSFVLHEAVEAGCLSDGSIEYYTCDGCELYFDSDHQEIDSSSIVVPALGHDYEDVRIAHNPQSNLKLASGIADVPAAKKAGIVVGLGTDGTSSNNNLDMLEEIRLAAMLHKATTLNPLVVPAAEAWQMGTLDGAKVLGFENVGLLEPGYEADIVLWDMHKPYWYPRHNKMSQLVYAANANDADTVLVAGKVVLEGGKLTQFDEERIYFEAERCAKALIKK